jgi:ABC-type lipoprotein export system ATPase subunit
MIKLENVYKVYEVDKDLVYPALQKINLTIKKGELTAITGPSGSGKSTLMHIIGLFDEKSRYL